MASHQLAKITKRAKQIRKEKPSIAWQDAIKKASKEIKTGKMSGINKKPKKATKKRVTVVNISGTKNHHKKKKSMAKKKTRRRHHRRRGIGAIHTAGYMPILYTVGGSILGGVAGGMIDNMLSKHTQNPKITAGVELIGGAFLAKSFHRSPLMMGVGLGIAAYGGGSLLRQSGFLKGIGESDYVAGDDDYISGNDDDAHGLAGDDDSMSGDDDYMSGDDDM